MIGPKIGPGTGTQIWIVAGVTDMRRGFVGLSGMVQTALAENPFSGQVFVFRGKRGVVVGRRRAVSVCEATGARAIYLATGQ